MKVIPGTVQSCSAILQGGDSLAVSPGGVYEAQFSDHNYKLMWNKRLGFAKVAIDAKVVSAHIILANYQGNERSFESPLFQIYPPSSFIRATPEITFVATKCCDLLLIILRFSTQM